MKDNFSQQSDAYSRFRPHYPKEMIAYLVSFSVNKYAALDIATGNGQVAAALSQYFDKIYATDISEKQLQNAVALPNVIYQLQAAEATNFNGHQFDLITVAQAIHWFKFDIFYKEIYRILKPDGIFAVLGYGLFSTNEDSNKILHHYYYDVVGPYWDTERKYLDEMYQTIPFPFDELEAKSFENNFTWTFEQLIGYLETWSATQHYKNKNRQNPIDMIYEDLKQSWARNDNKVNFPLLLRIGKKSDSHLAMMF